MLCTKYIPSQNSFLRVWIVSQDSGLSVMCELFSGGRSGLVQCPWRCWPLFWNHLTKQTHWPRHCPISTHLVFSTPSDCIPKSIYLSTTTHSVGNPVKDRKLEQIRFYGWLPAPQITDFTLTVAISQISTPLVNNVPVNNIALLKRTCKHSASTWLLKYLFTKTNSNEGGPLWCVTLCAGEKITFDSSGMMS